jgi:acyl-CoA reductase-like NAD-dependent aldehyde dehydrogenase
MALVLKEGTSWSEVYREAMRVAPEAFDEDRIRNLVVGEWLRTGEPGEHRSPVDGSSIQGPPRVNREEAEASVRATVERHADWSRVDLEERRARVTRSIALMRERRDLLASMLMWEIGKPWRLACADVDRCLDGVEWYVDQAERQLADRKALDGPVSNIASWNYPMSVQVHAELVQMLAGNAVVAKTPSQGGFHCLTLAHALMAREGLPVTLVSGRGSSLGDILIRGDGIGCLAFVGGRATGRKAATALADTGRRHFLEQEGLNTWGVWDFSQWDLLAGHLRKGFQYAKQRCTAYPRYVIQRKLFAEFLEAYRPAVESLRFGHPLAVEDPSDPYPELDFGPVISADKASELHENYDEAVNAGGIPILRRTLEEGRFIEGQDTSAYVAPAAILEPPTSWSLHHREPFGPLDSMVLVDSESEFIAAMNASNGALVASVATDDTDFAHRVADELQAFKIGINKPRSRGDREEIFGGKGASWKGAFVGGDLLVQAVTQPADGSSERLYGNFSSYALYPPGAGLPQSK